MQTTGLNVSCSGDSSGSRQSAQVAGPLQWEEECQHLAAWACLQSARGEQGQGGEGMETKGGRKRGKEQLQESRWEGKPDHPPFRVSYREAGMLLEGAAPPTAPLRRAAEVTVACVMVAL